MLKKTLEKLGFWITAFWGCTIMFLLLPLASLVDKKVEGHAELKRDFMFVLWILSAVMVIMLSANFAMSTSTNEHRELKPTVKGRTLPVTGPTGMIMGTTDGVKVTLGPTPEMVASIKEQIELEVKKAAQDISSVNNPTSNNIFSFSSADGEQARIIGRLTNNSPFVITGFEIAFYLYDDEKKMIDSGTRVFTEKRVEPGRPFEYHITFTGMTRYRSAGTKVVGVKMEWKN